jgi:hypothetical protein
MHVHAKNGHIYATDAHVMARIHAEDVVGYAEDEVGYTRGGILAELDGKSFHRNDWKKVEGKEILSMSSPSPGVFYVILKRGGPVALPYVTPDGEMAPFRVPDLDAVIPAASDYEETTTPSLCFNGAKFNLLYLALNSIADIGRKVSAPVELVAASSFKPVDVRFIYPHKRFHPSTRFIIMPVKYATR